MQPIECQHVYVMKQAQKTTFLHCVYSTLLACERKGEDYVYAFETSAC